MAQSAWTQNIRSDDFQRIVIDGSNIQPVLVDFWAPWCAPCRMLGPILEGLANAYGGRVHLAKVNTDEEPALAQAWRIQGIPAVKLFHAGRVVEEFVGVQPESTIRTLIDKHLPNPDAGVVEAALAAAWRGATREAREMLGPALSRHPDDVHLQLASCLVAILQGDSTPARQTFDALPAQSLADPLHEPVSALLYFVSLLEKGLDPHRPGAATRLSTGTRQILAGRAEEAIQDWLEALPEAGSDERSSLQEAIRAAFPLVQDERRRLDYQKRLARSLH